MGRLLGSGCCTSRVLAVRTLSTAVVVHIPTKITEAACSAAVQAQALCSPGREVDAGVRIPEVGCEASP